MTDLVNNLIVFFMWAISFLPVVLVGVAIGLFCAILVAARLPDDEVVGTLSLYFSILVILAIGSSVIFYVFVSQ